MKKTMKRLFLLFAILSCCMQKTFANDVSLQIYILDPERLNCVNPLEFKGCISFNGTKQINAFLNKLKADGINPVTIEIKPQIESSRNGVNGVFFGDVIDYGVDNYLGQKKIVKAAFMIFSAEEGIFQSGRFRRNDSSRTYENVDRKINGPVKRFIHYGDLETLFYELEVNFSIEKNGELYPFRFVRS